MDFVWWLSFLLLFYVYLGYPAVVWVTGLIRPRQVGRGEIAPRVTILIAAHNERDHIGETIRNKLALDYPREKLEVVVVSDGSADGTDEIVEGFAGQGVRLLRQELRKGKTAALNLGMEKATGEIIVFSDANSLYRRDALKFLVSNFHDPEVGYVTGRMIYRIPGETAVGEGCGAYMRYENRLRLWETRAGSVVGVDGGIDAVRRKLFSPMEAADLPDLVLPLQVVERGFRVVYDPRAVLEETALGSAEDEYRMRVRVSLRSFWAIRRMRHLLNPCRYGIYALQLWSHKLLRYLACIPMVTLLVSSAVLAGRNGQLFLGVVAAQFLFYASGLLAWALLSAGRTAGPLYMPYYFLLVNVAAAHAAVSFALGRRIVTWQPRKG